LEKKIKKLTYFERLLNFQWHNKKKKREVAPTLEGQQIFFLKVEPLRVAKLKKKKNYFKNFSYQ
jgi:hypothetical protein